MNSQFGGGGVGRIFSLITPGPHLYYEVGTVGMYYEPHFILKGVKLFVNTTCSSLGSLL